MDENYRTLKRPKRKLCYNIAKESPPIKWTQEKITLEDVDKMFDDLGEDTLSPFPAIHIPTEKKKVERNASPLLLKEHLSEEFPKCQKDSNADHPPPSTSPELDVEIPFEACGPVKTSSPIEGIAIQRQPKEKDIEGNLVSPILFDCEDEENHDSGPEDKPSKKLQNSSHGREESDESVFETLPRKFVPTKISTQKMNVVPIQQKNKSRPVTPVRPEPTSGAPEQQIESAQMPSQAKHNMTAFLQKLRDAGQPKPTRMLQAKVTTPSPEPEDDFLILEDDTPLWVSIPVKSTKSLKQKQNKKSSSDKEMKESSMESVDKQEIEQESNRLEDETPDQKLKKKMRDKGYDSHSTESDNDKDKRVLPTEEPANTDNVSDQVKTNKIKRQMKKVQSKDANQEDKGTGSTKTDDEKQFKKTEMKTVKTVGKKGSKSLKNNKGNAQKKRTLGSKESRKGTKETNAVTDTMEEQSQECSNDVLGSVSEEVNRLEAEPAKDFGTVNLKQKKPSSSIKDSSDEDGKLLGKRKRKQTGQWWMSCPQSPEQPVTDNQPTIKKTKPANKDCSGAAAETSVKATTSGVLRKKGLKASSSSSSESQSQKAMKKKVKKSKGKSAKRERPAMTNQTEEPDEVFAEPIQDRALDRESADSSPLVFSHRDCSIFSGDMVFHKVYHNSSSEKLPLTPEHASSRRPEEQVSSGEPTKRRRQSPGHWWEVASSQPQGQKSTKHKAAWERKKQPKDSRPSATSSSKPPGGAPVSKQKKRSLTTFKDLHSTVTVSPPLNKKSVTKLKTQPNTTSAQVVVSDNNVVSLETDESRGVQNCPSNHGTLQESTLRAFRSGPSSMIELENYEDSNEDIVLPSSRVVHPALCATDLCAPPLKPLILQPKDKVNLTEWLKNLWSTTVDSGTEITPDHFEWYFYQGRACGLMVDLHSSSICNGKMLLGSFMKKPLWVDHSATTVFNLLTSSVSVIIDCNKSCYSPGQSFMVPSGHAYSIHNLSAQPAVLYFTRIIAEELDE